MNVDFSELYYSYKLDFLLNIIIVKRLSSKHYSKYHKNCSAIGCTNRSDTPPH